MQEKIANFVLKYRTEIIDLTQDLIAIPSITGNEKKIISFLKKKFEEIGFDEIIIDEMGNLIGKIGTGKKILAIDGHVDTVEIGEIEDWKFDPFNGEIKNGKLYGRGACDQKGGLAATLIAVKILKEIGIPDDLTLYVLASINEELFEGMNWQHIVTNDVFKPDAVLLTEPSNLNISLGHRGRMDLKVEVKGVSSHGAEPDLGKNAIYLMADIISDLEKMHKELSTDEFFGKATLAVTDIHSKTVSLNAVPNSCQIHIDRRLGLSDTKESVLGEITKLKSVTKANAKVYVTKSKVKSYKEKEFVIEGYYPTWKMDENEPLVKTANMAFKEIFNKKPNLILWRFSTNGVGCKGLYDIPTIGFGPGDERNAHTADEFVLIDQLLDATKFYTMFYLKFAKEFKKNKRGNYKVEKQNRFRNIKFN